MRRWVHLRCRWQWVTGPRPIERQEEGEDVEEAG
jgi:hypothetical protein